jgi:voltage-gated potassium channel
MKHLFVRLGWIVALLAGVLAMGTLGYRIVEGQTYFDSFYMALTSLTTVGYSEVWELSHNGRIFTSALLLVGVVVVFAAIGLMSDLVLRLELEGYFGRRRVKRMLAKMREHYIVCGAGRVGRGVVHELQRSGAKFVLIDNDAARAAWAEELGVPTLVADASLDETLIAAGIAQAKGLVAAIGSDAENVYVTLSARVLNPSLRIAARATGEQAEEKLRRAGATTVFTPYTFIGHRLAQSLLRPHVLSFLDVASAFEGRELDLDIEQVKVSATSPAASQTLEQSRLRQKLGVIVLAVMKPDGTMQFNPDGDTLIEAQDILIAMGERSKLQQLERSLET